MRLMPHEPIKSRIAKFTRTLPYVQSRGRNGVAQKELYAGGFAFNPIVLYTIWKPMFVSLLFLPSRGSSRLSASRAHCYVCNTLVRQYCNFKCKEKNIVYLTSLKSFIGVVPLRPPRSYLNGSDDVSAQALNQYRNLILIGTSSRFTCQLTMLPIF